MAQDSPIVLAHGIARFDALWAGVFSSLQQRWPGLRLNERFDRWHYFRNIKSTLEGQGFKVFHSNVPFAASRAERAAVLAQNVAKASQESGGARVHIIGHSMGGLDARFAIARLGISSRVAALSTIGTPHLGSSFADFLIERGEDDLEALARFMNFEGLLDLTTEKCSAFNRENEQAEADNDVSYRCFAATESLADVFYPLRRSWRVVENREGPNDGLVSAKSQLWVEKLRGLQHVKEVAFEFLPFSADHFNECGWWDPAEKEKRWRFEAWVKEFYVYIASSAKL